jgi:hypothetical protein
MNNNEWLRHINGIRSLVLKYGMNIAGQSAFRLLTIEKDGSNYYGTTLEEEQKICERKNELAKN